MLFTPSHAEMGDHPKTKKLARRLGIEIPQAVGHLHLLWHFALKVAPDGDLTRFDADDLAEGARWPGDAAAFVAALEACGWLDAGRLHDWEEYGGKYAARRRANADRMRERRAAERSAAPDQESNSAPRATHVQRTRDARATLEKRRGENSREQKNRGSTTPTESRGTAAPDTRPQAGTRIAAERSESGVKVAAQPNGAQPNGTLRARYSEQYRKAGDQREKADALGGLFKEALGAEPNYPRLMAMAKRLGSGGRMIEAIIEASTADITDDPHDYLEKLIQRKEGERDGRAPRAGRGAGRGDARRLAGTAAYYADDRRPEDSWSES